MAESTDALEESLKQVPDEKRDRQGRTELLEISLAQVLGGGLGEIAESVGLAPGGLQEVALRDADQILAPLDPAWRALELARADQRRRELKRIEGEFLPAYAWRVGWLFLRMPPLLATLLIFLAGFASSVQSLIALLKGEEGLFFTTPGFFALALGVILLFRFAPRVPALTGAAVVAETGDAFARSYSTQLREGVAGWVREEINEAQQSSYVIALQFGDRGGLAEVDDPKHEIPTDAKGRLLDLIEDEAMPGGAIGLAGPRGAGKSTLMRALCSEADQAEDTLGTLVDAPVDYDPRDFVLHLFAKVCAEVVGPRRVAELHGRDQPIVGVDGQGSDFASLPLLIGVALVLAAFAMLFEGMTTLSPLHRFVPLIAAVALFAVGMALLVSSQLREGPRRRRRRLTRELLESGTKDGQTALAWLQQIWFQRTFSSGWSGSFKSSLGFESSLSGGAELAERQMSFPEIVDSFRRFLEQISQTRQVRIGIDELDKMDDETARKFLNEIKVVFRVPGCFFLISISEDAMSYFERRGLPIRDVFDSSFDEVIWVPYLSFEGSRSLLARRIVGLPRPFVCLVHCISGGLPRDLIRAARKLVELPRGTSVQRAAVMMSQASLGAKLSGARVTARKYRSDAAVRVLVEWLDHLQDAQVTAASLRRACADTNSKFLIPLDACGERAELFEERVKIKALGMQLASAAYFLVTLREFFGAFASDEFIDYVVRIEGGESRVDWLAGIPQKLGEDLGSGWRDLSLLRYDCGMEVVSFPSSSAGIPRLFDPAQQFPVEV
ncbi:MAG TPA: P-loop NTPase fold protein [Solirubrobacterales bacterium]|jgi:ABC-type multidrug transport system fused ATPase/permease subunit|nr:P-loop NTPase fold protein [Solirubrobacterales bacterium]